MAAALVDLSARPGLSPQGRPRLGSLRPAVRGPAAASGRVRDLRRREVPAAGARAPPSDGAGRARSPGAGRVRVPPRRHAGLSGRLGRPSRPPLRPLRAQDGHRAVRPPRRASHELRALRVGQDRVLYRRQRLKPRRAALDRPARERLPQRAPDPSADPRLVAEPDRDLLLDPAAQGADTERLRQPRRTRRPGSRPSKTTTARSPSRSSGPSRARISTPCSPASRRASRSYAWLPNRHAANSTPPGVRATPARTATA